MTPKPKPPPPPPKVFSADEGADVGKDGETPVSSDDREGDNSFTGKRQERTIEVGPIKLDTAEMKRQAEAKLTRRAEA